MFSQHEITWDEHQAWFYRMQVDHTKRWFLYLNENNEPSGVVYFTALDPAQRSAFWGFYASPDAIPGTGLRMEFDALSKSFGDLGLYKLNCEVLASNKSVINMHKKVGFTEEGCFREHFFEGEKRVDVIRLGMLASEWPQNRVVLVSKIGDMPR